jgi:Family of unknown function (DUF6326)
MDSREQQTIRMENVKRTLSALWIFVTLNYLYCDLVSLIDPGQLKQYIAGHVNGIGDISPGFLLGTAILVEIPISMVLLSRLLKYRVNRWANIAAGAIMTVVQFVTLFVGSGPAMYYTFFSIIEIACTLFIVWYAWRWQDVGVSLPRARSGAAL